MRTRFACVAVVVLATLTLARAQQTFTGRLSDSTCGASHQPRHSNSRTDRECLLACIGALARYVLVDSNNTVIPIANQDAVGLPFYAGRPVRLAGERSGDAIVVTKVEAIPAHLHIGHVVTNWRDTPGGGGFLPVAADEAKVAVLHARLAATSTRLDDIKLHAGHVLHALDPTVESKGPGAGYGVKKATSGAMQHLDLAARAEGATPGITTHAAEVSSALSNVLQWTDQAIAIGQRIRATSDAAEASEAAADLATLTLRISDEGLQPAETGMSLILKAEGLLGVPR